MMRYVMALFSKLDKEISTFAAECAVPMILSLMR